MDAEVQFRRFSSPTAYNSTFPHCAAPTDRHERNLLRRYTAARTGVEDDLAGTGGLLTVDFFPGGAPLPDEPDRSGAVVATSWGNGPYVVLATDVSLRSAWDAIRQRWPMRLSEVRAAISSLG